MKKKGHIQLRAQAMHFALLVSVVVALLLSAFLLLIHSYSFFGLQSREVLGLVHTTNQGFATLSQKDTLSLGDTITTKNNNTLITSHSSYYGAWQKTLISTTVKTKHYQKCALTGTLPASKPTNLYLANSNTALVVVGSTRIEGNNCLPGAGIKAGTIAGEYYQGSRLAYGTQRESKKELPRLDPKWIIYLEDALKGNFIQSENLVPLQNNMTRSYLETPLVVYAKGALTLSEHSLSGNITLITTTKITIERSAKLHDVLLIAPEIAIKNGFKGRLQALASKQITVGKECRLQFPSSLVLLQGPELKTEPQTHNTSWNLEPAIHLNHGAVVEGGIVYLKTPTSESEYTGVSTDIMLGKNVQVTGEVYCQGNTELLGTVKGSLYTKQFVANQKGSIYMNHLYNGKIFPHNLPEYGGLPFSNQKNTLVKWLY